MLELLEKWASHFSLFIAGLFGAAVAARWQPDITSKKQLITFLISGAVSAQYLTQIIIEHFGLTPSEINGTAFLVGAFSGSMIARLLVTIQTTDFRDIVRSWFGGGK